MVSDEQALRAMKDDELRDRVKHHISYLQAYGAELQRRPEHRILGDAISKGAGDLFVLVREERWKSGG